MPYLGLKGNGLLTGVTVTTGMGFILFGYDDGVMGGLLTAPSFDSVFHLDSTMQGTTTSLFVVGAFLGCLMSAFIDGRVGRKPIIHVGSVCITIGAILQASSFHVAQLLVGRIIAGIGLGLIVANIIVWESELSPSRIRGRLVASALTFLILGDLVALWLEYGIVNSKSSYAWRLPLALQAAWAIILSVLLYFMPESPRWLLQHERTEEAIDILRLLNTHSQGVDEDNLNKIVLDIREAIAIESKQATWSELFKSDKVGSRRRVVLSCILNACQAWCGSTSISYYTTFIFQKSLGLSYNTSLLLAGILQVFRMITSIGTWYSIERWGRRVSFMTTAAGMTIVMALLAVMISIDTKGTGYVAAALLFVFEALYSWGYMGPIWVYGPEIIPLAHRAKGEGLATASLWLSTFVAVEVMPIALHNIGWKTYIIFAVANLSFIPFTYFCLPETAGLGLEALDICFMNGENPVKKANELRKDLKAGRELPLEQALHDQEKGQNVGHVEDVNTSTGAH